jgi:hypothetical protein
MQTKTFTAITRRQTGSFELSMAPKQAFPLFTAPGEKRWIPTWEPLILNGDGYARGTVWLTEQGGTITHWLVADFDEADRYARYVRTTPNVSTGTVEVKVISNGSGGSTVQVAYQLTGLSDSGNQEIEKQLEATSYQRMMEEWKAMIEQSLSGD